MIVEFAGCTGAGKTTFASGVAQRLREEGRNVSDHTSRGSSVVVSMGNCLRTLAVLPGIVFDWNSSSTALRGAWTAMDGRATNTVWRLARFASTVRRVGDQRSCMFDQNRIHVADEGSLGVLELALGGSECVSAEQVGILIGALALPDVIVWVDAPLKTLVDRTMRRADPPRELRALPESALLQRVANSRRIFQMAFQSPSVAARVIPVSNSSKPADELEVAIDAVADLVRDRLIAS